ncbi:MAG: radical SAM protein [Daejeonella sp.]
METAIVKPFRSQLEEAKFLPQAKVSDQWNKQSKIFKRLEKFLIWKAIKLKIFFYACLILKNPALILRIYKQMLSIRSNVWGGDLKKMHKINGRYYFNMYTPGWPSNAYDQLIKTELSRHILPVVQTEKLSFVFFAITRKCPLRCEHCFEWDNLNKKETLSLTNILKAIDIYQKEGALQFHFSGGEPMVRIKDLLKILKYASKKSECWVLSSGFNLNQKNALALRNAGCTGIVISIDHYIAEVHDLFRGHENSFQDAILAVKAAKNANMVVSVSVCATKSFIEGNHLIPYIEFAKNLGVQFIQVLEPRDLGNYTGKDVLLNENHILQLEEIFLKVNHSAEYQNYPTLLYHGFHQRRIGCFSGSRSIYIDSAGDVHACPFCHTASYNIIDLIESGELEIPQKENQCPRFGKIA